MGGEGRCILLVEDDANDVFFLRIAFEKAGVTNPLHVASDGQHAMDYLAGTGKYSNRDAFPLPCLLLLDLNLPMVPGLEVLRWKNERKDLAIVVTVVLSSSADPSDIEAAYSLGAASYLVKPLTLDKRVRLSRLIREYWLELNCFCPRSEQNEKRTG